MNIPNTNSVFIILYTFKMKYLKRKNYKKLEKG